MHTDGFDIQQWELDAEMNNQPVDWAAENMDPAWDLATEDAQQYSEEGENNNDNDENIVERIFNGIAEHPIDPNEVATVVPINQPNRLRNALITHFTTYYNLGKLQWPKNMRRCDRQRYGLPSVANTLAAVRRAITIINDALYIKPSSFNAKAANGQYTIDIGQGLFSKIAFLPNDLIAEFCGEIISIADYTHRLNAGRGGYGVALSNNYVMDCYDYLDACKASRANDYRNLYNAATNRYAIPNASLVIDHVHRICKLVAKRHIPMDEEIFYKYGSLP